MTRNQYPTFYCAPARDTMAFRRARYVRATSDRLRVYAALALAWAIGFGIGHLVTVVTR